MESDMRKFEIFVVTAPGLEKPLAAEIADARDEGVASGEVPAPAARQRLTQPLRPLRRHRCAARPGP